MERTYIIKKDPVLGFGFVAGGELPTIVKYIQPDGPSSDRLLPKDMILAVNGINVEKASREQIIKMVELSDNQVELKVKQMEEEMIKFFSEIERKTVLKYNVDATVGELLEILNEKFLSEYPYYHQIRKYFGIVLTYEVGNTTAKKIYILNENDSITKLKQLDYAPKLRLIYRMINPPADINVLFKREKFAFEYLYQQSCNDLKIGRFRPELNEESSYRLSALHLLEYVYTNHSRAHKNSKNPEVYLDLVKENHGLKNFIAESLVEKMVDKKKRIINSAYKKMKAKLKETLATILEEFDPTDSKFSSPSEQVKFQFLTYLSQLPCYGNSERPPVGHNSPSSLSSSLDRTSDSLSLIRPDDSVTNNFSDQFLESKLNNRIEVEDHFRNTINTINSNNSINLSNNSNHNLMNNINHINNNQATIKNNSSLLHRRASERYCNSRFEDRKLLHSREKFHTRSNERLQQEMFFAVKSIDETLRSYILPPPPPPSFAHETLLRVLTDKDIENLRVPPPPMY